MPVSSLVLHLSADAAQRAQAVAAIESHPRFLSGDLTQRLFPIALDTSDEEENKACWGWLNRQPGVDFVEVLSVVFPSDSGPSLSAAPVREHARDFEHQTPNDQDA